MENIWSDSPRIFDMCRGQFDRQAGKVKLGDWRLHCSRVVSRAQWVIEPGP